MIIVVFIKFMCLLFVCIHLQVLAGILGRDRGMFWHKIFTGLVCVVAGVLYGSRHVCLAGEESARYSRRL